MKIYAIISAAIMAATPLFFTPDADASGCAVVVRQVHNVGYGHFQNYGHAVHQNYNAHQNYAVATTFVPVYESYKTFTVGYGENYGLQKKIDELTAQVSALKNQQPNIIVIGGNGNTPTVTTPQILQQAPAPQQAAPKQEPAKQALGAEPKGASLLQGCAKCHAGTNAKGGFDVSKMTAADALKAINQVVTGKMPPASAGGPFTPEKNGDFILEISALK